MKVYVVTGLDLGWDCIVGVFIVENDFALAELKQEYPEDRYVITVSFVETLQ